MLNYRELIELIKEIYILVNQPYTDIVWTNYNSVAELLEELDLYSKRLMKEDEDVIKELVLLFAPTGNLQEVSISSGWGQEFIELSSRLDTLISEMAL